MLRSATRGSRNFVAKVDYKRYLRLRVARYLLPQTATVKLHSATRLTTSASHRLYVGGLFFSNKVPTTKMIVSQMLAVLRRAYFMTKEK